MSGSKRQDPPASSPLQMPMRWQPCGANTRSPVIVVAQGDLTRCSLDAIVNPANSFLSHGGGVAGAIARSGGRVINDESRAWIKEHQKLPVGRAMSTSAGRLPCRFVIHTVGPSLGGGGSKLPTPEQAQLLRNAVWSALCEADSLRVTSVAMPGISSGIFGYPRDLAAKEILGECVRYACERAKTTSLKEIVLLNIDSPTCDSFVKALREVKERSVWEAPTQVEVVPPRAKAESTKDTKLPKSESFDVLAVSLAVSIVAACADNDKMAFRVIHRSALSCMIGELGALAMELLNMQKTGETTAVLEALKGKHQRRVPFYMSPAAVKP